MRLDEIMSVQVVAVGPEERAGAAWLTMQRERIRHLIVMDGARLVGVLSERDLGGRGGADLRRGRVVRELMAPRVATASPGTTLRQAANMMRGRLIGCLPVLQDERVVGIVTATDVLEELGRGSTRPTVRAKRRDMRLPPASARKVATPPDEQAKKAPRRAKNPAKKAFRGDEEAAEVRAPARPTGRVTPALGRDRIRTPDNSKRAPLADRIARPAKRLAGSTAAAQTPVHIRGTDVPVDRADRDYLRRKLGRKLGKFATAIERASVRIEDANGPRGGVDKRCEIKVVLSGLPSVVVTERHQSLQAAMDGAIDRITRTVRRALERRKTRATRGRGAAVAAAGG
ncbi:MAG: CBS domain-containing protein [Burkholderiales bacterium]|nr:CBS domain-containing protein [Burkholderiales bacterium]